MNTRNQPRNPVEYSNGKKLLRGEEVAEILNCSPAYVFKLIRQGQIPGVYLGRSVRVRMSDLEAFIAAGGSKGKE